MQLKSLELIGFKSFVDRTVVKFEPGVTGIVGPNGSGKSNVVDAIRWVMGEQSAKHLRGGAMQDVIFAGSQGRPPTGMAAVTLTFDNSDGRAPAEYSHYAEITVARRLYRSGESEYYINKTPCRLKDIVDLFLGTGTGTKAYSIVEQGRIGQIVTSKPEERRLLIEEAAGISKFRNRRDAAQRKMDSTRVNLERLQDITRELERQLGSLQRQAKKAEKYKVLSDELRVVELQCAAHHWQQWQTELHALQTELTELATQEENTAAELANIDVAVEKGRVELTDVEQQLDVIQERAYALQNKIHLHEANIQHKTTAVSETTQRIGQAEQEIEALTARRQLWNEALTLANETKVEADLAVAVAQEATSEFEGQVEALKNEQDALHNTVQELERESRSVAEAVVTGQSNVQRHEHRREELARLSEEVSTQRSAVDAELGTLRDGLAQDRSKVQGKEQQTLELSEERESVETTLGQQREATAELAKELQAKQEQLSKVDSRLHSLEALAQNLEGYHAGVKAVLQRDAETQLAGMLGTIADTIDVPSRYAAAAAAILGERVQGVVVEEKNAGVSALNYLRSSAKGRSAFIPLDIRVPQRALPQFDDAGALGYLASFFEPSARYQNIVNYFFGDVLVVQTLDDAVRLWDAHTDVTFVTTDGEVLTAEGVLVGGSEEDHTRSMMTRKHECESLREELATLQTAVASTAELHARHQERVTGLEHRLEALSQDRHAQELVLVKEREELNYREAEIARLTEKLHELEARAQQYSTEQESLVALIADAQNIVERAAAQRLEVDANLEAKQAAERELRAKREEVSEEFGRLRTNLAAQQERVRGAEREIERLVSSISEAGVTIERRQTEIREGQEANTQATTDVATLRGELEVAVREAAECKEQQGTVQQQHRELQTLIQEQDAQVRSLRRQHDDAVKSKHSKEMGMTQQSERVGYLRQDIFEKYHVDLELKSADYIVEDFDEDGAVTQRDLLRGKVEKLGGVNTDAIAEYDELSQRYEFLTSQAEDLEASLASLQRAIHKINRVSRERFKETFHAINERFQRLFPKVFSGGQAELRLTEEDNLLESGVEIVARPPGKKLQNLTLLSGGEKAMTAVALIFAMFLVRPSPFCLLDEVDAPLDEANVDRFNQIVRDMTGYAQFILITHNKRTMELADALYGVTMEQAGVSKLVSVKLSGRDEAAGDDSAAA